MNIRIALIDDGIEFSLYPGLAKEEDLCVHPDGSITQRTENEPILTDHGTTSARIICKYAPTAKLCSLQVFTTNKLRASINQLLAALDWCYHESIPIIHLSLGSTLWSDYEPLRKGVMKLIQKGQILIAAHCNGRAYTMPACFTGVLGVAADETCSRDEFYIMEEADWNQIQIYASSRHELSLLEKQTYTTQITNSFAAPVITAKIHEILSNFGHNHWTISVIYRELASNMVRTFRMQPDFIDEVILYQPKGKSLFTELFFFSVKERVDSKPHLERVLNKYPEAPIVVIPSGIQEDDRKVLQLCEDYGIGGFLYAGKAGIETGKTGFLFWDEGQYCDFINHADKTRVFPDETARLLMEDNDIWGLRVAKQIQKEFEKHNYPCIIISDYQYAYLYGTDYLPEGVGVEDFSAAIAALKQVSVVIYCLMRHETVRYDFRITLSNYGNMEAYKEKLCVPKQQNNRDIEKLYQYVLDYDPYN